MRTLETYQELDTDTMMKGFFQWLFDASPMSRIMPVKEVRGNNVLYNVDTTRGGASWTQPGDVIPESTGTTTQRSAALSRLIGDADVDKSAIAINSEQNPATLEIEKKANDMMDEWETRLIHGQQTTSSESNQPKGMFRLIAEIESEATTDLDAVNNTQVVAGNAASGALTIDMIDELIDACKMGATDIILSRRMRRKLNSLARASGNNLVHDRDELGHIVTTFGDQRVWVNDHIEDAYPDNTTSVLDLSSYALGTTRAAGNDNSVIFAVNMSNKGLTIIQAGPFTREPRFTVPNKDAWRYRFKWYNGFALWNKFSAAVLTGVLDTAL